MTTKEHKIEMMKRIESQERLILELEKWNEGEEVSKLIKDKLGGIYTIEQRNKLVNLIKDSIEQKEFMVEGINEQGLSAGLFYFPNYGKYQSYDESLKDKSLADFQVVSYVLAQCSTTDEVKETLSKVRIINIDPR